MNFDAIKVHSAPEVLAQQIIERIKAGKLKPGECLPSQRELARMFEVGLGTVREALKILDVMGCVDVMRGKGSFVAKNGSAILNGAPRLEDALEAVSLAELMKAREVVEVGAAGLAAEKADAENIKRLREITSRMTAGSASSETYYENDFKFHIAVAEAAQNQAILEIVKLLVGKTHTHTNFMDKALGISLPAEMKQCSQSAVRVVDWIEKNDAERAADEMRAHLNIVTVNLKQQFPQP
jgi:GntR family transcriptional regulator, transcriptional repressor for pyruvate dehydrogenase complex